MSTSYEIVFSADTASHWTPVQIDPGDDVKMCQYYELCKEDINGKERRYILTDHGMKRYTDDLNKKGDFIVF